jgi:hypothetical protein
VSFAGTFAVGCSGRKARGLRVVVVQQKEERQQKETPPFVSQWSPTCVLEKALSCLTSLIGREAVYPGWYERFWKREAESLHYILLPILRKHTEHPVGSVVSAMQQCLKLAVQCSNCTYTSTSIIPNAKYKCSVFVLESGKKSTTTA